LAVVLAVAVEPAVRRRLHARSARLHVVLRVEMAPGRVRGADRVDRGEGFGFPQWLERCETGVQAEIPVQVQDVLLGHGEARPFLIINRAAMRKDNVEHVYAAALDDGYETRVG